MSLRELLADYATKHRDRANLAIHAVTVPLAVLGVLTLLSALRVEVRGWGLTPAVIVVAALIGLYLAAHVATGVLLAAALAALAYAADRLGLAGLAAAAAGPAMVVVAVGLQGAGHRREAVPSRFSGPGELVGRLLREQLYLAPLFLVGRFTGFAGDDRLAASASRS